MVPATRAAPWSCSGAATATGPAAAAPGRHFTLDGIVAAATELADAEGRGALTMRRVAQALGIAPMSLYTYVPGSAELLDLMLDAAYAAMPRTGHGDRPWRDRLAASPAELGAVRRHPWAALVCTARPPLGPGMMAKYEHELRAFDGTGLSDVERDAALTYLLGFVQAAARAAAEVAAARTASAQTEAQWWAANGPLLAEVLDAQRYPTAARVGAAAGAAHDAAYDPGTPTSSGWHGPSTASACSSRADGRRERPAAEPQPRSARSTTLLSSMARVIGPTPPGIGAMAEAMSATSDSTSPV